MKRKYCFMPLAMVISILAACKPADNDPGPGGVTVSEARELDEAAAMLDAQRIDAGDNEQNVEGTSNAPE